MWEVKDRSVAGLRIAATGGIGQSLSLGALVAVRQSDADAWLLGVVRRLNKVSNEEVEAGVNIIADRVVAVIVWKIIYVAHATLPRWARPIISAWQEGKNLAET